MRSCLVQLLILVALVFGLLWFGLPLGAGWLATNALNAAGFNGTGTRVDVSANPPFRLLAGQADSVQIVSKQVSVGDLHAAAIDLTFGQVDLISRHIETVDGQMAQVRVASPSGDAVMVDAVTLSGPASAATAGLSLSIAEARKLAESELAAHGVTGTVVLAPPNRATIKTGGQSLPAHLVVALDGSLVLVPDVTQLPRITLLAPGSGNPFHVTAVSIAASGATLTGTIDVQSLLGV
jgi:hypothetical protein